MRPIPLSRGALRAFLSHPLSLSILSGVLLALGYMVPALWIVALFAFVPLFFALANTSSPRAAFVYAFLSHSILLGSALSFFFSAHPLTWAGVESSAASFMVVALIWLLALLAFSLPTGVWGIVVSRIPKHTPLFFSLFASTLWVTAEIAGSLLFALIFAGSDVPLTAGWTFGYIGYALAEFPPLLALSSVGGVYLLSFFVVLTNCALFFFLRCKSSERKLYVYAVLLLITASSLSFFVGNKVPSDSESVTVANTYTTFEPSVFDTEEEIQQKWREFDILMRDIRESDVDPDIVLLPETVNYMAPLSEVQRSIIFDSFREGSTVVINSEHIQRDSGINRSTLAFYDTSGETPKRNVKQFIVPGGEYLPYIIRVLGNAFLEDGWSDRFESERALVPGASIEIGEVNGVSFSALACSETISPFLYQDAARNGAEVLLNSASYAVFGTSRPLIRQITKFSKVRAAESNRYLVQASNAAPSYTITNRGRLLSRLSGDDHNARFVTVPVIEKRTLYTRLGYAIPLIFIALALALSTGFVVARRKGVI